MSSGAPAVWWVFVSVGLAVAVFAVAFGVAMVASQRRVIAIHREHARHLLAAQEEERAWVAREVHDDMLQRVTLLGHELEEGAASSGPAVDSRLAAIRGELDDLEVVLRGLAHRLHPSVLDRGGLVMALRDLALEIERSHGLKVSPVLPDGVPKLSPGRSLAAYRIAQEALRNVARHAGVREAVLRLAVSGRDCELSIIDAGRGLGAAGRNGRGGIGLISLRERAAHAGGTLEVQSEPGRGTVIRARFPLDAAGS